MTVSNRVLLVCWSGANWGVIHSLMDAGQMPHLASLVENGIAGELVTLQPQLDPLLWTSLATGCRGDKHGILSYLHANQSQVQPTSLGARHSPALWDITSAANLRTHVVGWPTYPAETINGSFISSLFARIGPSEHYLDLPRSIHTGVLSLNDLKIDPRELTHRELLPFVPRAAEVDQTHDPSLAIIATWLAEWTTTHMAATAVLEHDSHWNLAAVCYDAIGRFSQAFMRFHPPWWRGVPHHAFELYQGVINAVYRFADMQLGRLIELAGPEATIVVCSQHGFRSGKDRPAIVGDGLNNVAWHRPLGILAMRGPQVRRDEWLWGASILDVCPTVLSVLGLDYGGEMDGHVLTQVFTELPQTSTTLGSLDPTPQDSLSDTEARAVLDQLVHEGILTPEHIQGPNAAAEAKEAFDFNLATVYLECRQHEKALALFAQLAEQRPQVARYWSQLASCQLALGQFAACRETLAQAEQHHLPRPLVWRTRAQLLQQEGNLTGALEQLFLAEQAAPHQNGIHAQIGEIYLALANHREAERAFRKELEHNADSARACHGLGEIAVAANQYETALERYLDSVTLQAFQPLVHCRIGMILLRIGRPDDAERALGRSLLQHPRLAEAHYWLAKLYGSQFGKEQLAAQHQALAGDWQPIQS